MCKKCWDKAERIAMLVDRKGRELRGDAWKTPKLLNDWQALASDLVYVALCDDFYKMYGHESRALRMRGIDPDPGGFLTAITGNAHADDGTPVIGVMSLDEGIIEDGEADAFYIRFADGTLMRGGKITPEGDAEDGVHGLLNRAWAAYSPQLRDALRSVVAYAESVTPSSFEEVFGEGAFQFECGC